MPSISKITNKISLVLTPVSAGLIIFISFFAVPSVAQVSNPNSGQNIVCNDDCPGLVDPETDKRKSSQNDISSSPKYIDDNEQGEVILCAEDCPTLQDPRAVLKNYEKIDTTNSTPIFISNIARFITFGVVIVGFPMSIILFSLAGFLALLAFLFKTKVPARVLKVAKLFGISGLILFALAVLAVILYPLITLILGFSGGNLQSYLFGA